MCTLYLSLSDQGTLNDLSLNFENGFCINPTSDGVYSEGLVVALLQLGENGAAAAAAAVCVPLPPALLKTSIQNFPYFV